MTPRTRLLFGSAYHHEYIGEEIFNILRDFCCLPPAVVDPPKDIIRYEIPQIHIAGFPDPQLIYYATLETDLKTVKTEAIRRLTKPLDLLVAGGNLDLKSFDRITIHREEISTDCNLLKEDATFSAIVYQSEQQVTHIEGFGHSWKTYFRKDWICPSFPVHDPKTIVFRCRPVFAVEVIVDGHPGLNTVRRFLKTAMPKIINI